MSGSTSPLWKRRGFIGGILIASGAGMGWAVRRLHTPEFDQAGAAPGAHTDRFLYDVSEFEKTDPALLLYQPVAEFATRVAEPKRITLWPGHGLGVAGVRSLSVLALDGEELRRWPLPRQPHCLLPSGPDQLIVGYLDRFEVFDPRGRSLFQSPPLKEKTFLTSLAIQGDTLFAADAGQREIIIVDRRTGEPRRRFGRKDPSLGNPGFNVPSPYFALSVAPDQRLRVVNPGLLRVETYTPDGRFISAWGEPGLRIDRFCGCCNPVYFTLTNSGDFITSEKGLARINVYSPDGGFKGAVAGPETLVTDKELAKRACQDCRVGAGFDVAVEGNGDVFALDPIKKTIRHFKLKAQT